MPKEWQTENKDHAASDKWNCHFFKMKGTGMALNKGKKKGPYTRYTKIRDSVPYFYFPVNQTNKDLGMVSCSLVCVSMTSKFLSIPIPVL